MAEILIYTKDNCQQCKATKKRFDNKGVSYENIPIDGDNNLIGLLMEQGHTTAPVVSVLSDTGELLDTWAGFQPSKIDRYADGSH